MNYVFLNHELVHQYDPSFLTAFALGKATDRCPAGSYVYNSDQRSWYAMRDSAGGSGGIYIKDAEVPTWAKALLLLIT